MLDLEKLEQMGKDCGFTYVYPMKADTVKLMQDVRDMCAANTCGMYGKNWCCPPGVGELDACRERLSKYQNGILVQTVGQLEDELDAETMMETESSHKKNMDRMHELLLKEYPGLLALGAGTCTRCKKCTYPDQPCRFPDNTFASMEAFGMLVTQVCQANNAPYYYGPCTLAYTGCFILE